MNVDKMQASQAVPEKKVKKQWNAQEDEVLVEALFQLVTSSYWKVDNGFSLIHKLLVFATSLSFIMTHYVRCLDMIVLVAHEQRLSQKLLEDIDNNHDTIIDDDIATKIIRQVANGDVFLTSMGMNMDANVDENIDLNMDANVDANMDFSSASHNTYGQPSPSEDSPSANHFTPSNKGIPGNKGAIHKKRSRASEGSSDALRDIASSFKDFVDISKEHIVHIKENQEVANNFHTSLTTILERDQELKEKEHEVRKRDQLLRERELHIKEMQETPSQKRTCAISELMKMSCFSRMEGFMTSARIGFSDTNVDLFLALGEADRTTYVKELLRQDG